MTACLAPRHDQPEPAAPHARLCRPCTAWLRRDLHRLPALHAGLGELLDPRRASGPGTGSGGGLPYHEPAAECMSQIRHDVTYWTMQLIGEREPAVWPVPTLPAMCGWLAGQAGWVMYRPWAGDMAGAFLADARRARAVLDPMPRAEVAVPRGMNWCPRCRAYGRLAVVVSKDEADRRPSVAWCGGCGAEWDTTRWLSLGREIVRERERQAA